MQATGLVQRQTGNPYGNSYHKMQYIPQETSYYENVLLNGNDSYELTSDTYRDSFKRSFDENTYIDRFAQHQNIFGGTGKDISIPSIFPYIYGSNTGLNTTPVIADKPAFNLNKTITLRGETTKSHVQTLFGVDDTKPTSSGNHIQFTNSKHYNVQNTTRSETFNFQVQPDCQHYACKKFLEQKLQHHQLKQHHRLKQRQQPMHPAMRQQQQQGTQQ